MNGIMFPVSHESGSGPQNGYKTPITPDFLPPEINRAMDLVVANMEWEKEYRKAQNAVNDLQYQLYHANLRLHSVATDYNKANNEAYQALLLAVKERMDMAEQRLVQYPQIALTPPKC
jgi:hypothetical protein